MNAPRTSRCTTLDSQPVAPRPMSETRPLYWSIRRELWENRSLYLAPLIVAAVVLFALSSSRTSLYSAGVVLSVATGSLKYGNRGTGHILRILRSFRCAQDDGATATTRSSESQGDRWRL